MATAKVKQADKEAAEAEIAASQKRAEELAAMATAKVKQADKEAAEAEYAAGQGMTSSAPALTAPASSTPAAPTMVVDPIASPPTVQRNYAPNIYPSPPVSVASPTPLAAAAAASITAKAPPAAASSAASRAFLIVTERRWKWVVIGHDDERAARAHVTKMWSCWIIFARTEAGAYSEVACGGMRITPAPVFPKIRSYFAANLGQLDTITRRPSIVS